MSVFMQKEEPFFRPMTYADLAEISVLQKDAHEFPWSEGVIKDCMDAGYYSVVLQLADSIEGFGIMSFENDAAHVLNVCIKPTSRRRGYAIILMNHLIMVAKLRNNRRVILEVRASNAPALKLYRRIGFVQTETRKDYYPRGESREDAHAFALLIERYQPIEM